MRPLANVNPDSLADAVERLDSGGGRAAAVGGGSDLLGMIKDDLVSPDVLVNLRTLGASEGLDTIVAGPTELHVGGLVTLARVGAHPEVASRYRVLAEAAGSAATPQIRNVGTLAGNLCQRPWCWYYRQKFPCYKHGGNRCFSRTGENQFNAIFGGGPSYIVHPSDTAPALVALDARFRLVGPGGERVVPAGEFFTLPRVGVERENVLEPNEILAGVTVPAASGLRSTYAKVLDREAWTHAVVSAALALRMDGDHVRRAGVVLGGVAPIPWRVPAVEELLAGQPVTEPLAAEAGRLAVDGARPLSKNRYKIPLVENLVRRTLLSLAGSGQELAQ
ncbi:MAG: FAD binding domain-containing protein [Acidobacteria bacterium]|nr:FAD binding domain-containing protein [Acidobacteriota bacterium]